MRCNKALSATLSLLLASAAPRIAWAALNPSRADHTVTWYRAHPTAMRQVHDLCTDDRTYEDYPDCKNAAAAGDSFVPGPAGDPMADMYDPQSYRNDPIKRRIMLAMCKSSTPPALKACQAAQSAAPSGGGK